MDVVTNKTTGKFYTKDENRLMKTYTKAHTPHTTFMPTLTGGVGNDELARFYGDFFLEENPPSLEVTLISRTSSANRVVDELHVAFEHTQGMPWILPGIPPTNKSVEIMIISIVTLRGGKIYHEHIYWDQASVLVQVGLLKQTMVPKSLKAQGVEKLPIVGKEPAERIIEGGYDDDEGQADNELLPEFWDYSDDEEGEDDDQENGGYVDYARGSDREDDDDDDDDDDVEEVPREDLNVPQKARGKQPAKPNPPAKQNLPAKQNQPAKQNLPAKQTQPTKPNQPAKQNKGPVQKSQPIQHNDLPSRPKEPKQQNNGAPKQNNGPAKPNARGRNRNPRPVPKVASVQNTNEEGGD